MDETSLPIDQLWKEILFLSDQGIFVVVISDSVGCAGLCKMVAWLLILLASVSIRGEASLSVRRVTWAPVLECVPIQSLDNDIPLVEPDDLLDSLAVYDDYDESNRVKKDEKWKLRMFKREEENYEDEDEDEAMLMNKRGQPWKMRMFKKSHPWAVKMYKEGCQSRKKRSKKIKNRFILFFSIMATDTKGK